MYRAVFFDRDGTLTHSNPQKRVWFKDTVSRWSGKAFDLPYEKMMALFDQADYDAAKDLASEKAFWARFYRCLLEGEGISQSLDSRAEELLSMLWYENNPPIPYPDAVQTLSFFKERGFLMGVISDTSPSLQLTMQQAGLAKYFLSFTASSLVGAEKPSPVIFGAALRSLGVSASESLYVDDYIVEADGAREQGFTSFWLDREGKHDGPWVIHSLTEMIDFIDTK